MASRFQQLGAFVGEAESLSYEQLAEFHAIGGRYIFVLVAQVGYPWDHDPACVRNLAKLLLIKEWCQRIGIAVGGWFNCWAGGELDLTPDQEAAEIERLTKGYNLAPITLDCEMAYKQYPQSLPQLCWEVRKRIKTRSIGVNTNEPNDSLIWNGGNMGYKASMRNLNIRMQPQWYSFIPSHWAHPDLTMMWLKEHGMEDNFHDPTSSQNRAVPLSYVHGVLEVTGMEGSSLSISLAELREAKKFGFTWGFQVYLLEQMRDSDYDLLSSERGKLFLT